MKLNEIRDLSKDDILSVLGLATKPSTSQKMLSGLSMFTVGLLVGAGVALMLAPKSGQDLREDLGQRLRDLRDARSGDLDSSDHASATGSSISRDEVRT